MNWTKNKPKRFKEDCLLLTATWFPNQNFEGYWDYTLFEIKKTEFDDQWYWGIFKDSDEWGDYADLRADKYCILPMLKNKSL